MDGAEFGCLTSHTALLVKAKVARAGCVPPPDEYAFQFSIVQVFTVGARRLDNEGRVNIRSPGGCSFRKRQARRHHWRLAQNWGTLSGLIGMCSRWGSLKWKLHCAPSSKRSGATQSDFECARLRGRWPSR